jgi:hypothetical protein
MEKGMRKTLIALFAVVAAGLVGSSNAMALPVIGAVISEAADTNATTQVVRWYHQRSTSRRFWVRGNLGRHACLGGHIRHSSRYRIYPGRC